jgi:hypothetical protein
MAISFVNSTGVRIATAASTWSLAVPAVTAGGTLIVGVGYSASTVATSTVTDNAGNVYTKAGSAILGSTHPMAELWYAKNVASCTRISLTAGAASSGAMVSAHFTGISTGGALGPVGSSATASSTSVSAATISPASAGVVVMFTKWGATAPGSISTTAGFTGFVSTNIVSLNAYGQYVIQGAPSATDGAFTTLNARSYASVIAVFYDTAGETPVIVANPYHMTMLGVQ